MRELGAGHEGIQPEEPIDQHAQLKQLVHHAIGFETELQEVSHGDWRRLTPRNVVFYFPNSMLSDPDTRCAVDAFSPHSIEPVPKSVVDDFEDRTKLRVFFNPDPEQAKVELSQAIAVAYALNPGSGQLDPLDKSVRRYYEECVRGLDTVRTEPDLITDLLADQEVRLVTEPLEVAAEDSALAEAIASVHNEVQGSWGVARMIENRHGQRPQVLDKLAYLSEQVDRSIPINETAYRLLAFHYLVAEPYYNLGRDQGIRPPHFQ